MKNLFKYTLITSLLGTVELLLLLWLAPGYAIAGEAIIVSTIFIGLFAMIDKHILKDIDTIDELKKGNIAYAITLLAIALVFVASAIIVG